LEKLEDLVSMARVELKERKETLVWVCLVKLVPEEVRVRQAKRAPRACKARSDATECLGLMENPARLVHLVRMVLPALVDCLARLAMKAPWENLGTTSKANSRFT